MKKFLKAHRHWLAAVLAGALFTALAAGGLLYQTDNQASDALYQSPQALSGDIVIIGIDAASIQALGPYSTWTRDVIARCIETLNADPLYSPAAIGIDVLYAGASNSASDAHLASAAAAGGNVVVACAATFDTALTADGQGGYTLDTRHIQGVDFPYAALRQSANVGHINGMYDADGVLRHSLLELSWAGEQLPSFNLALYRLWASKNGRPTDAQVPTDGEGFWYVDFAGSPGSFHDGYGVAGLLNGDYDPQLFAGKVVLIGPWAAGLSDSFVTAVSRDEQMYGVEYQANCIQALMDGRFRTQVSNYLQLGILFAVTVFLVVFFHRRKLRWCLLLWAVCALGWPLGCWVCYQLGLVLHPTWIPLAATLVFIASLCANYVSALLEKRAIRHTFQRYVAPEVIEELLKNPEAAQLGGREVTIAVLFMDIRGFTSLSETMKPAQVVQVLNEYLELTTSSILKHHGTLDKFIGDSAMAIWNAPLEQEDYVMNACRAALDMTAGAAALRQQVKQKYGKDAGFGVGVNLGPAVVGNVGSALRMDYTAIGDTVNTAARLEGIAPADTVYISPSVAQALAGRIRCHPLAEKVHLKGKAEDYQVYVLESILEDEPAAAKKDKSEPQP